MQFLIHAANVMFLLSYWVKDMRHLRIFSAIGIGFLIPYFLMQKDPLIAAACWNVVFLTFNLYRLRECVLCEPKP